MNSSIRTTKVSDCLNHAVFVCLYRAGAAVGPRSWILYGEAVAVHMLELGCKKSEEAEEQHDQDPLTHCSLRGAAGAEENGH